jgi:signal transduction histidine kinase
VRKKNRRHVNLKPKIDVGATNHCRILTSCDGPSYFTGSGQPYFWLYRIILLSIAGWNLPASAADVPLPSKRILILYSHRVGFPINQQWDTGIRAALQANLQEPVTIDVEYVDTVRLGGTEAKQKWFELLRLKYERIQPDLVIPVFDPVASEFLVHYRELFPDADVVLCSINERTFGELPITPRMAGVLYRMDHRATFELAQRVMPELKKMIIVCGSSRENLMLLDNLKSELATDMSMELEYWIGLPIDQLCIQAQRTKADSAILYLAQDRDRDGSSFTTPYEVAVRLAAASRVPVFGLYDTLMGSGILGGVMVSVEEQGRRAGQIAAQILSGKPPTDFPFSGPESNRVMVDWQQLERWGIDEERLPQGSVNVLFREPTVWQKYSGYLTAGLVLLGLQSLLIGGLLVNRSYRLRAETALACQMEILEASRQDAKLLAGKLLTAQEDERRRLAREMHDDITQRLAAAAIESGQLQKRAELTDEMKHLVSSLTKSLIELSTDVHQLSRRLHPSILDDLGLRDAIQHECDKITSQGGIRVSFGCGALPDDLPKEIQLCLFRIAQECLRNMVKHSQATRGELVLSADAEWIHLNVKDNGRGFVFTTDRPASGIGLASMEERVQLVGGQITIQSEEKSGTCINVQVPWSSDPTLPS